MIFYGRQHRPFKTNSALCERLTLIVALGLDTGSGELADSIVTYFVPDTDSIKTCVSYRGLNHCIIATASV
ncbi:hypothetical protein XELAEV_18000298mg [Xenopus laevis]|uniref:Uncharacterized protein n=1 Tax=Xenopus laevis TaxID=8355 RepID=A0A974BP13_XENLA|nr:hypothetical protein XELAEV_18000298mg [Xenopus laevis]